MKKIGLFLALLSSLVLSQTSQAAAPASWYNQVQIANVYSGLVGSNRMAFGISTPTNAGTCPATNEFEIQRSNPQFDTMVMMVMLAYSKAKPISVYTNGVCGANGLIATDIRLP
jgi:hypothetical protein